MTLEGGGGNSGREGGENGSEGGAGVGESDVAGGEGEGSANDAAAGQWEEVGKKNRSAVTRRHEGAPGAGNSAAGSPMAALFGGLLRSTVRAEGHRPSATIEPFFCLSLDVSNGEASLLFTLDAAFLLQAVTRGHMWVYVECSKHASRTTMFFS